MNFMNEWEIDEAVERFADDPVLGPASRTLVNLRNCANHNSDGWAYWPGPARAANKLMILLQAASRRDGVVPTAAQVRAAYGPIRSLLTRKNLTCEIVLPQ